MIQAGKLRHKIVIEQSTAASTNVYGEVTVASTDWSRFHACAAEILPQSGREFFQAAQVHSEMTHLLQIRYKAGISSRMRVNFRSRYLYLIGPPRDLEERHRVLQLACVEETS